MRSCFEFIPDDIEDYKNKINVKYNLYKNTLKEIFDSQYFRKIEKTWDSDPLLICAKTCGKVTGTFKEHASLQSRVINLRRP